ncbi:polysaccharide deacetylase family protein [Eubacterium coprostanoligenes]|uniref:polysaccharide deacetylase family protein n=1 Tax=Eubacterium coprostanoligenes TaxID=290054 RepID=UPI00235455A0|nr:polysaccharide deacetylase family protein [Eubacterium coprostanoligenes]MCI6353695.1 polysaccharide deacetylase family protein [Eubacterium coprostanoligenes]
MSRKIRLTGLFIMAVILFAGLIAICGVSSQNIGPVKSPVVVGTSDNSVKLSWKRVGSSDGYFVYQKKGDKLKKIKTVKDPQKLGCTVKNLDDSTAYTFVVKAFKQNKKKLVESEKFTEVSAFTNPKQQIAEVEAVQPNSLKISWQANSKCGGYEIQYAKSKDFSDKQSINVKDVNSESTDVMELAVGDEYNVRVRSYVYFNEQKINGKWSKIKNVKVLDAAGIAKVDATKPMIAVTFDDGPGYNGASDKILDVIEKYHIKATFFMICSNASNLTKNVKRKVALGCQIGNHTYNHEHYGKNVTPNDIIKGSDAIEKACGVRPTAFRSPGGITTELIRKTCKQEKMPLYYWSLDTQDWKSRNADKVYNAVVKNVSDGDIILMHEIYGSTADAFERMVPVLLKKGYQFVTCDELVAAKSGKKPEPGTQYVDGKTINNKTS